MPSVKSELTIAHVHAGKALAKLEEVLITRKLPEARRKKVSAAFVNLTEAIRELERAGV